MITEERLFTDSGGAVGKKFAVYIVVAAVITGLALVIGFSTLFVKIFNIFIFACFLLYIMLDLPPVKEATPLRPLRVTLVSSIIATVIYLGIGKILPQFNEKYEIEAINNPTAKLAQISKAELVEDGKDIFRVNKCQKCHKAEGMGKSNKGPNFDLFQIGLYPRARLIEDILDPRIRQPRGFTDPDSKRAMPLYFGEEIVGEDMDALLAFLGTLWSKEEMPYRGKVGTDSLVKWDKDPQMIELGKRVYEGEIYKSFNCVVCHGRDGRPVFSGATDLRNPNSRSKIHNNKPLRDWTDADWYDSVSRGVLGTPMIAWSERFPPRAIWLAIAYAKQFPKPNMD